MTDEPIVYVVDDDAGMRKSLALLLESNGLQNRQFASAAEFLDAYRAGSPGCLLLDLRMPETTGVEFLERLKSTGFDLPVIVLTGHGDVPTAVHSMKLGAADFLEKPIEHAVLLSHIRAALGAGTVSRQRAAEVQLSRERLARLTARERELLKLVVGGRSNKMIAVELGISIKTVEKHRSNLLAKTGAMNTADLVRMSVIAGF